MKDSNAGFTMFDTKKPKKFQLAKAPPSAKQILLVLFIAYVVTDIQFIILMILSLSFMNYLFFITLIITIPMPIIFALIFIIGHKEGLSVFEWINQGINLHRF